MKSEVRIEKCVLGISHLRAPFQDSQESIPLFLQAEIGVDIFSSDAAAITTNGFLIGENTLRKQRDTSLLLCDNYREQIDSEQLTLPTVHCQLLAVSVVEPSTESIHHRLFQLA
jgi:hypothetical protein